jgi:hypothetical protein
MLDIGPRFAVSNQAKGDENPQHAFHRRGNKAPCRKLVLHVNEPFEV